MAFAAVWLHFNMIYSISVVFQMAKWQGECSSESSAECCEEAHTTNVLWGAHPICHHLLQSCSWQENKKGWSMPNRSDQGGIYAGHALPFNFSISYWICVPKICLIQAIPWWAQKAPETGSWLQNCGGATKLVKWSLMQQGLADKWCEEQVIVKEIAHMLNGRRKWYVLAATNTSLRLAVNWSYIHVFFFGIGGYAALG
jgi:hypothetical protein